MIVVDSVDRAGVLVVNAGRASQHAAVRAWIGRMLPRVTKRIAYRHSDFHATARRFVGRGSLQLALLPGWAHELSGTPSAIGPVRLSYHRRDLARKCRLGST